MSKHLFDSTVKFSTLVDLLRWRALQHPERRAYTFLIDGERKESYLTYGELDRQARIIGAQLQSLKAAGGTCTTPLPTGAGIHRRIFWLPVRWGDCCSRFPTQTESTHIPASSHGSRRAGNSHAYYDSYLIPYRTSVPLLHSRTEGLEMADYRRHHQGLCDPLRQGSGQAATKLRTARLKAGFSRRMAKSSSER